MTIDDEVNYISVTIHIIFEYDKPVSKSRGHLSKETGISGGSATHNDLLPLHGTLSTGLFYLLIKAIARPIYIAR